MRGPTGVNSRQNGTGGPSLDHNPAAAVNGLPRGPTGPLPTGHGTMSLAFTVAGEARQSPATRRPRSRRRCHSRRKSRARHGARAAVDALARASSHNRGMHRRKTFAHVITQHVQMRPSSALSCVIPDASDLKSSDASVVASSSACLRVLLCSVRPPGQPTQTPDHAAITRTLRRLPLLESPKVDVAERKCCDPVRSIVLAASALLSYTLEQAGTCLCLALEH